MVDDERGKKLFVQTNAKYEWEYIKSMLYTHFYFYHCFCSAWAKQANVYASDSGLLCNHDSIQYVVCNLIRGND